LFWGFSFGWGVLDTKLAEGPARLTFAIDKAGEGWRQVDAVLLTDDLTYVPHGREKPPFPYHASYNLVPPGGSSWRGQMTPWDLAGRVPRQPVGGRDFSMWAAAENDLKWWGQQNLATLSLYDVHFQFTPPSDIRDKFHKQYAGRKDLPILSFPDLLTGFYLGNTPDLSPDSPLRKWLEQTKTPFYIMTNYATGSYNEKNGPATYAALTGPLARQFLGYIHGEALGTGSVFLPDQPLAADRRGHADAILRHLRDKQAEDWSKIYKTKVAPEHFRASISCLSVNCIAMAHLLHEAGCAIVGYEVDATNVHVPMRIAFERGAARQYGGAWINYASGNFGDACNYFTQNPVVPRGAPAWFHSKYSITDGVTAAWYRKLYYLNYLGGASAIYWEQNLFNQWMVPGPGTHPVQLSPFGRATEEFLDFVQRCPDRGEPYTPIGLLLNYGHGYERVNYSCKMFNVFPEDHNDIELRELFNVWWHPTSILEGLPAAPDVQSMPSGVYGDIFDVLVDRPQRAEALTNYPIIWAAGDVRFHPAILKALETHLQRGGTLVVNIALAGQLPQEWLGFQMTADLTTCTAWGPVGAPPQATTPFRCARVQPTTAQPLAVALAQDAKPAAAQPLLLRNQVGRGAVIVMLVPRGIGLDERAHPALPYLMNGLTQGLLPVDVRLANGRRLQGEVMYSLNKTKNGWLVALYNHRGLDKTQTGIARVDRRAVAEVALELPPDTTAVQELTEPRKLTVESPSGAGQRPRTTLRIPAGDVHVVEIRTK
ncbi:MAG: hypothetical protein NZO58_11065, partial [Gemmataceae bacterium]|nr:hypothetical protein [Gemmataceae bacterium]